MSASFRRPTWSSPSTLPREHWAAFWLDVCAVARAVRDEVGSSKINYEIHGNTVPHLHLHVFPRYPGDPFTGAPIDGASRGFRRLPAELPLLPSPAEAGASCAAAPATRFVCSGSLTSGARGSLLSMKDGVNPGTRQVLVTRFLGRSLHVRALAWGFQAASTARACSASLAAPACWSCRWSCRAGRDSKSGSSR